MKHLKFDALWAHFNNIKHEHPQLVMLDLGISYAHATPQPIADCWIFWACENLPDDLPPYLSILDTNPIEWIGHGLSEESAKHIIKAMGE